MADGRADFDLRLVELVSDLVAQVLPCLGEHSRHTRSELARLGIDDLVLFLDADGQVVSGAGHGGWFPFYRMARRESPVLSARKPFQVEAGQGQPVSSEVAFRATPVEAEDRAGLGNGQVAVGAPARLDRLVHGPGLAFVVAELHREVLAVTALARFLLV